MRRFSAALCVLALAIPFGTSTSVRGDDAGVSSTVSFIDAGVNAGGTAPALAIATTATSAPAPTATSVTTTTPPPQASAPRDPPPSVRGTPGAPVRLRDRRVFSILVARSGRTAEQRAAAASQALERVADETEAHEVRVEEHDGLATIYVGAVPIVQVGPEDVAAASDVSLSAHASAIAIRAREALRADHQRSLIAQTVFSFSLVLCSALVAFLLLRKLDELIEKARGWMRDRPDRLPSLSIREIEVVQAAALRGGLEVALTIGKRIVQVAVGYAWIVISFSLFESTRDYTQRLTGFVLTPLSALMGRVAAALPVLVIAVITGLAVSGALRFVRLFFGSVARGETALGWLPRDLAGPTSILVRAGIVVATLVVSAPLLTGADDGALSRVGIVAVAALGVAVTPFLSNAAIGTAAVFGGKLRVGSYVSVGTRSGWVRAVSLLEIVVEEDNGGDVHIPHLLTLWHPTKYCGISPPLTVELSIARLSDLAAAVLLLEQVAGRVAECPRVEVASIGIDGARIRITIDVPKSGVVRLTKNQLFMNIAKAFADRAIGLGKSGP